MSGHYRKEKNCLNCGHLVEAHYCSQCGQPNLELKEPFWHFIGHSIGHYFHFDSKFFQTLVPLLTQPGQITLDYLAGKRARYIHPVSLYIFVSIVYFLIVPHALEEHAIREVPATKAATKKENNEDPDAKKLLKDHKGQLDAISPKLSKALARSLSEDLISDEKFSLLSYPAQTVYLDSIIKLNAKVKSDDTEFAIDNFKEIHTLRQDSTYNSYLSRQKKLPAAEQDHWFLQKLKRIDYGMSGKIKTTSLIDAEFNKYKPKQYFLLMPLLAFFIMINFRKNKIYYINHLVFTVHGMTAFFIVSIVTEPIKKYVFGLDSGISNLIEVMVFCGIAWYLYRGLKLFYNRSRKRTILKMISLMVLYAIALYTSEGLIKAFIIYILP